MSGGEGSPSKGPQPPPKLVEGVGEGWEEIDASSPSLNSSNAQVSAVFFAVSSDLYAKTAV